MEESDRRPFYFCPLCLRKLHRSIGFDVMDRYQEVAEFPNRAGFYDETVWVRTRMHWIQGS